MMVAALLVFLLIVVTLLWLSSYRKDGGRTDVKCPLLPTFVQRMPNFSDKLGAGKGTS